MAGPTVIAECYWPGVRGEDLRELDHRVGEAVAELRAGVRYLGSILVLDDEVVLCLFEGPLGTVREVADRARIPFERILQSIRTDPQQGDIR
jgi:hypothetical protein